MSPFLGSTKHKYFARVVWFEESKNGLGFDIGPNYDDVPTRSQLLTDRQSSCKTVLRIDYREQKCQRPMADTNNPRPRLESA